MEERPVIVVNFEVHQFDSRFSQESQKPQRYDMMFVRSIILRNFNDKFFDENERTIQRSNISYNYKNMQIMKSKQTIFFFIFQFRLNM